MKIHKITINKYKAFKSKEILTIGGKNVFIYGENGSGKSSFYYALKDFFQSSIEPIDMSSLRNLYLDDGEKDCSIEVEFDNQLKNMLNESAKNTNTSQIIDANRLKSFLTYKHLLAVHNVKIDKELDLFDLIVDGVLKHFKSATITGGVELGVLWKEVQDESKKPYGRRSPFYYYAKYKKASVESKANVFNQALNGLFLEDSPDYIGAEINNILKKLFPDLIITFQRKLITVNSEGNISIGKILIIPKSNGIPLDNHQPQFVLNEAKLSAIAISIFLGAIVKQKAFSEEIKPLFLDDILIGLDNENRLKLLDVLKEDFSDFQIFLTTYDRHWFEVAKLRLSGWSFIEFYKGDGKPAIIQEQQSTIERARSYFEAYDFPACANYLRKECENLLKEKLLETYKIGDGLKGLVKPPQLESLIDRLKTYYEDMGIDPPEELINNLFIYKSILFNPMSHNDITSPIYKNDLEKAFKVIDELQKLKLPARKLIIEKDDQWKILLPQINYEADIIIAKNVYAVDDNGIVRKSPIEILFQNWWREGVQYANSSGTPPKAVTNNEKLDKIKLSPFSINKAMGGIYSPLGIALPTEEDFMKSISKNGKNLFDVINQN